MLAGGGLSLPKLFVPSVKVGGDTGLHDHCSHQTLNTYSDGPVSASVQCYEDYDATISAPLVTLPCVTSDSPHCTPRHNGVIVNIVIQTHQYYQLSLSAGLPKHFKAEGSHRPGYWLLSPVSAACPVSGCRVTCSWDTRHRARH